MTAKSLNGYTFTASMSADGTRVTLVAAKDDHEGKETHTYTLDPSEAGQLETLIRNQHRLAKERRRLMRQAVNSKGE